MTDRGVTLIELVVAVALLAFATVALLGTMEGAIKESEEAAGRRVARELAASKLEEMLAGTEREDSEGGFESRPGYSWAAAWKATNTDGLRECEVVVKAGERRLVRLSCLAGERR